MRSRVPCLLAALALAWSPRAGEVSLRSGAARETQDKPAESAPASRPFRLADRMAKPVARVGSREITTGEILQAARAFYPEVLDELDSPYGEQFLDSYAFDDWVDAYVDLCVLERDPRIQALLPDPTILERGIVERARLLAPPQQKSPRSESRPSDAGPPPKAAIERARRFFGFDVARQIQLDSLVPRVTDPQALRRALTAEPWKVNARLRIRDLLLPTRSDPNDKRFERDKREGVRLDAERVLGRWRGGEAFEDLAKQIRGKHDARAVDTLPWIAYDSPLPIPVVRALFAASKGDFVGPIETRDGAFIAKILDREITPAGDFETVKDRFATILRRDAQADLLAKLRGDVAVLVY
jgi:hypothetical protein